MAAPTGAGSVTTSIAACFVRRPQQQNVHKVIRLIGISADYILKTVAILWQCSAKEPMHKDGKQCQLCLVLEFVYSVNWTGGESSS